MTVIGCPDVAAPVNGWMRQEGSDVIMGCNASAESWRMYCDGNRWVANAAKNCTPGDASGFAFDLSSLYVSRCVMLVYVV